VGPRASLDAAEKRKFLTLLGLELQPLGHPARSQLLSVGNVLKLNSLFKLESNVSAAALAGGTE
jgi:hypothetical protein